MATEQERLRAEVAGLRVVVTELVERLPGQVEAEVQTKVETEVAAKGVPREEYRRRVRASGRRTVAALIFLLLFIVVAVVWNRVTLQQANEQAVGDFRRLITICRTSGPPLAAADLAFCEGRVPGFAQARVRVLETAATARRNEQRLTRLEQDVADLRE